MMTDELVKALAMLTQHAFEAEEAAKRKKGADANWQQAETRLRESIAAVERALTTERQP